MSDASADRLVETWRLARSRWRAFAKLTLAAAVIGVVVALITPNRYTAQASFFPESHSSTDLGSSLGGLASLASLFGSPLGVGSRPAQFFTDLAKSRTFLDSLTESSVQVDTPQKMMRVADYLVRKARTEPLRRWAARKAVQRAMRVTLLPSGVVLVTFTVKSPYAAAAMANRAIEIIDELNIDFRRREAAARRRFTQQFLDVVQQRLSAAQDRVVQFLTANRTFAAPVLQRQLQSLQVEVERLQLLQQQLETSIENARLTEYNDAPVVATVDVATVPERKSTPNRKLMVIGFIMAALVGGFWALYLRLWR